MKIVFIQGIHNYSLGKRFLADVSEATGLEITHFPMDYGLFDHKKHLDLLKQVENAVVRTNGKIIILAHSFGGILAHSLSDETYTKVEKVITLATPHGLPTTAFKRLTGHLSYRSKLPVPLQESCGFYMDLTVPYFFTKNKNSARHLNHIGTHTRVPNRKTFFKNLVGKF